MIVGCYTLDLYCDGSHETTDFDERFPCQYTGTSFAHCRSRAILDGWKFSNDGKMVLCSQCVSKGVNFGSVLDAHLASSDQS
jgi:hypothetical protein